MSEEYAISVSGLKKNFKIYYDRATGLKEKILFRRRSRYETREVIKGISFDVKKGEAVGIIGKNGCGKSTLLKIISRILYPDDGTVEVNGKVSALIELGAGFHPDMTGRENIYINASILGFSKKEIDDSIDKIIEFSELDKDIDSPVRTYSSGMYMRLAFSIAINVKPDILLIDEILAVGDYSFQIKCFNKLKEIKERGTTIFIVSHSLDTIEQICDRCIWIEDGVIRKEGESADVNKAYIEFMLSEVSAKEQGMK